ncbi:MAG: peptide chain release factor 2 [Spirochaetales bacterium]|nr:peptide chain release factor 2 [Spirochaetales bacterium]
MLEELHYKITTLGKEIEEAWGIFDLDARKSRIETLEKETEKEGFWQDREKAGEILSTTKKLRQSLATWKKLKEEYTNCADLYDIALEEKDQSEEKEIHDTLECLENELERLKILELLNEEHDSASAFLTIHSGAGGTEACDWVSMLLRMYLRWADNNGYKTDIIDILEVEGGIKSVLIQVEGEYAYGYLKTEAGVHRLVRISPFDSSKRRHTSFASVFCNPVIDDSIEIDIRTEDLRIDTYRSTGAGGQHVNKTDSAVRITHLPTGIVAQCQNERSQHKNKSMALKVLKSRLYEHEMKKKEKEKEEQEKQKKDIAWGSQIRSYVFHPYSMVKDHRTKYEIGNIQAVMDGAIDPFIQEFLKLQVSGQKV